MFTIEYLLEWYFDTTEATETGSLAWIRVGPDEWNTFAETVFLSESNTGNHEVAWRTNDPGMNGPWTVSTLTDLADTLNEWQSDLTSALERTE